MITLEEFVETLVRVGSSRDRRPLPRKRRVREILMKSILLTLDSARTYREDEINEGLRAWNAEIVPSLDTDHVTLRRMLVEWGYLERTRDGRAYRVGFPAEMPIYELEIEGLDVQATVAAHRDERARRTRPPI